MRTCLLVMFALAFNTAVAPTAAVGSSPTSFEGHVDIPVFAIIVLPVDRDDVAPYVPAGLRTVDVNGETGVAVNVGIFENTSVDFENGTSRRDPAQFAYSDLAMATYGPQGSGPESGGVVHPWRLAGAPIFPEAMARLGVTCGGGEPPQTRICHVPHLTMGVETSVTQITVNADVPWGFSPYSVSASFVPTTLPCALPCLPFVSGWHAGSRGLVRENGVWSNFPDSATIGVGAGTVRAVKDSPLYHILGDREEATGWAILARTHIDATFTLQ